MKANALRRAESDIIKEMLTVKSVAERYIRAITARDEAAAAQFTCRKKDGSMLWISAVGRRITVLRVTGIDIESPEHARLEIQVEGAPPSPLSFQKSDGKWCVWP